MIALSAVIDVELSGGAGRVWAILDGDLAPPPDQGSAAPAFRDTYDFALPAYRRCPLTYSLRRDDRDFVVFLLSGHLLLVGSEFLEPRSFYDRLG
jgi:hypothetical protein